MPPKRVTKAPEPTDRVTRHSATKPNQNDEDSDERPSSAASDASTVVPSTSSRRTGATNWSDLDTSQSDFSGFEVGVNTASTQNVEQLLRGVRVPAARSPDHDDTQFFGTANESSLEMAGSDDEGDVNDQVAAPAIAGISPEMLAFFQMHQQAQARADAKAEKRR